MYNFYILYYHYLYKYLFFTVLLDCMYNVYEHLDAPKVPKEIIDVGLICVAKFEDKYYRLQISAYDIDNDCCEFKYLDYGGYDSIEASELLQVCQDFLNLPFQVCFLLKSQSK